MDISQTIQELKKRPDFADNVGMILVHNGTVRSWSRNGRRRVTTLKVDINMDKVEALRLEYLKKKGIYDILIEARSGSFSPGDDLLFIVVAGDLRENIKPVLAELLDRIKAEAVEKQEL
ncbi:MAG: molybdenum cofactor biosynthesis protein [Deltaproteobacteria bacterium]|nr:MAG: molybdenum cofactor biosynthesis protein [Deltaproteobacteria bacterium]